MKHWPHAPVHILDRQGTYMVTCGTYRKAHYFAAASRLNLLQDQIFSAAEESGWKLQAWAFLSNHYHIVALSPDNPETLKKMLSKVHTLTAAEINRQDRTPGRRVWYQFYDTRITYQASYLSRLKYVHGNPVHHGLVRNATLYPWCSAAWFVKSSDKAFCNTVRSFKDDKVNVQDGYDVVMPSDD